MLVDDIHIRGACFAKLQKHLKQKVQQHNREQKANSSRFPPATKSKFSPAVGSRLCLLLTRGADGRFLCLTRRSEGADSSA